MIYYKVVTKELKSLGLRKNPFILQYQIDKWHKLNRNEVRYNFRDYGGIWVCQNLSGATKLKKYIKEKYNKTVRIFICEIGEILYQNSYRIKTDKVKLIKEIR